MQRKPGGGIGVRVELEGITRDDYPGFFAALGAHLGLDPEPLYKAAGKPASDRPEQETDYDPRYPALFVLIQRARKDWRKNGALLVAEVEKLIKSGRIFPINPTSEALLRELFRDHQIAVSAAFSGVAVDPLYLDRLRSRGLVVPEDYPLSLTESAYRLGIGLSALRVHPIHDGPPPTLNEILKSALGVNLTEQEKISLSQLQRRSLLYLRRPFEQRQTRIERAIQQAERAHYLADVEVSVRNRESSRKLAERLRETALTAHSEIVPGLAVKALQRADLLPSQNDWDRVARTELANAYSWGAYEGLKAQASRVGHNDPIVYKLVRSWACADCRRIWGPSTDPNRYPLSEIEAWEAEGGNFDRPRSEWRATIGPVHPNCTEGPILFYHPELHAAVMQAANKLNEWRR